MQNKGVITLLAILLAVAGIYQLSFTFVTWNVRNNAKDQAEEYLESKKDYIATLGLEKKEEISYTDSILREKERNYIDSVASEEAYPLLGYTYRDCQSREINLGLDLKGGMNVTLEVSVVGLVKGLSNNSQDPTFLKALKLAQEKQVNSQADFMTLFYESFKEVDSGAKLSAVFGTQDLQDRINSRMSNDEVFAVLQEEAKDAIDNSFNILRTRIDRFGVVQPNIQRLEGATGRILVELPGIKEPKRVRKLLQGTANLEFWLTYNNLEIYPKLAEINNKLREMDAGEDKKETIIPDSTATITDTTGNENLQDTTNTEISLLDDTLKTEQTDLLKDSTENKIKQEEAINDYIKQNPLFAVLRPRIGVDQKTQQQKMLDGASVGVAHQKDTAKVNKLLSMPQSKALLPRDLKFIWNVKAIDENEDYFELVAVKADRDGGAVLSGDVVTNAREQSDPNSGQWEVTMTMNADGAGKWAKITKANINKQIAIVLDNYVYSYPNVNSEIKGGNSSISGNFTVTEAKDLANILKSGKLPAPAVIIEEEIVGPSLGEEAVNSGLVSFILAFILVLIYMVFFYKTAGLVADLALISNIFFIFGVLASLGAVLTLPGIAGIVLTIGMSVDANVLIYERIKEELALGKGLKLAVKDGYKNAYSAIIDANITTLLTGIILYIFGHGPIKGFATTLVIGILTSLFSAIFITRIIFTSWLDKNKPISFFTKFTENAFKNASIKFIEKRKIAYIISGAVILMGIVSLFVNGLNQGVDFKGGRTFVVRFDHKVVASDIATDLKATFGESPEVKTYGESNQVKIVTKFMIDSKETNADSIVETKLYEGLKSTLSEKVDFDKFISEHRMSSQKVGPTIADDIKIAAVWAILFSLLAIFAYIFLRFRNWQYGLGAIAALTHDVLIVLGLFSLLYPIMPFSLEINQAFIAAILTVVGYSVNDTVVVFDRIREFLNTRKGETNKKVYNDALNSTLSRTFSTSLSTFVVLLAIFIFGGEVIQGFIFALLIGVVVGTYSSLFIATPVVYDTVKETPIKSVEVKKRREYTGGKKKDKKSKLS